MPSSGARALASIFDNLENGNLTDAKQTATRYPGVTLITYATENVGGSNKRALRGAQYLKGDGTFQAYCDAKNPIAFKL